MDRDLLLALVGEIVSHGVSIHNQGFGKDERWSKRLHKLAKSLDVKELHSGICEGVVEFSKKHSDQIVKPLGTSKADVSDGTAWLKVDQKVTPQPLPHGLYAKVGDSLFLCFSELYRESLRSSLRTGNALHCLEYLSLVYQLWAVSLPEHEEAIMANVTVVNNLIKDEPEEESPSLPSSLEGLIPAEVMSMASKMMSSQGAGGLSHLMKMFMNPAGSEFPAVE